MTTDVEQKEGTEEKGAPKTAAEKVTASLKELSSKESENVSTTDDNGDKGDKGTEEVKPITFATQADLDKHIEGKITPLAQGMKDKELKPAYDEIDALKKENTQLKVDLEDKAEDSTLTKLEAAEKAGYEGEDEEQVKDFQEARREFIKVGQNNRKEEKRLTTLASGLEEVERQQSARQMALDYLLPDDKDFLSDVDALTNELAGADEGGRKKILELRDLRSELAESQRNQQEKPPPDSSGHTAPGGVDFSKLSPADKVKYHLDRLRKK